MGSILNFYATEVEIELVTQKVWDNPKNTFLVFIPRNSQNYFKGYSLDQSQTFILHFDRHLVLGLIKTFDWTEVKDGIETKHFSNPVPVCCECMNLGLIQKRHNL